MVVTEEISSGLFSPSLKPFQTFYLFEVMFGPFRLSVKHAKFIFYDVMPLLGKRY